MLYCNHCYARVVMRVDNASATTCVFCKQTIKTPVELTGYAGLVAQQKHKKIVKLKNILGALAIVILLAPFIIHMLLILTQRPHEFWNFGDYETYERNGMKLHSTFMRYNYHAGALSFGATAISFFIMLRNVVAKLDYINFKKRILWFAIPLVTVCIICIYWESGYNIEYFPINPWFAGLETAIKIVQLLIMCIILFIIIKSESVFLAFRAMHFAQSGALVILTTALFIIIFVLSTGIKQYALWYEENVYDWWTFTPPVISAPGSE